VEVAKPVTMAITVYGIKNRDTMKRARAGTDGPSWLSFIGHMKDSLWSVDPIQSLAKSQPAITGHSCQKFARTRDTLARTNGHEGS